MSKYRRLSIFAIASIILLRLGVGYHFYMEGLTKVREGNFSSTGFLNSAKGPLADDFQSLVPDHDGAIRLGLYPNDLLPPEVNQEAAKDPLDEAKRKSQEFVDYAAGLFELHSGKLTTDDEKEEKTRFEQSLGKARKALEGKDVAKVWATLNELKSNAKPVTRGTLYFALCDYADNLANRYRFTDTQLKALEKEKKLVRSMIDGARAQWDKEIRDYTNGFDRHYKLLGDGKSDGVTSLRNQRDEVDSKWKALPKPALSSIDKIVAQYEKTIQAIATPAQSQSVGVVHFKYPGEPTLTTRMVDKIIPIFDMVVGILLLLGLLTPLAAGAAGIFLISVVLSQFPGAPGAQPTYFQVIEVLACFALVATDAGRYCGLDYLSWTWWQFRKFGGWQPE